MLLFGALSADAVFLREAPLFSRELSSCRGKSIIKIPPKGRDFELFQLFKGVIIVIGEDLRICALLCTYRHITYAIACDGFAR